MIDKFTKAVILVLMAVFISAFFVNSDELGAASRDCDANALVFCGTLNKTELYNALNKGTGKTYQSSTELTNLFGYYGIYTKDFEKLVDGVVTNDNRLLVNNTVVKNGTNVYTMGRSYMPGSTKLTQFPYPIYKRYPSVSFRSSSIPAYVMMNPDGTFAYAILKSCGNIVPGIIYKTPAPASSYILYALKWLDVDGDGRWEAGEPRHPGVTFSVNGNGINKNAVTDSMGYAWFYGMPSGTYTIRETVPSGYRATTATSQTVVASGVSGSRIGKVFGNTRIVPTNETAGLQVYKYNDINNNQLQDASEPAISGWNFRVSGPNGVSFELTTGANGYARRDSLVPGIYTVTEVEREGWVATTQMSVQKEITRNTIGTYIFGNRLPDEIVPATETDKKGGGDIKQKILPVSGPVAIATMAGSAAVFSGAAVAWARSKGRFKKSFRK